MQSDAENPVDVKIREWSFKDWNEQRIYLKLALKPG